MRGAFTTLGLLLAAGVLAVSWRALAGSGDLPAPVADGGDAPVALPPGPEPSRALPVAGASAADEPQVWIEVDTTARLLPPAGAAIAVVRQGTVVAAACEVLAGDVGAASPGAAGRLPLVAVRFGTELYHRRAARRDDGALGVELGFERSLRGRVVDAQAQPVGGAQVWCGGEATRWLATDADGRFEALVPAGAGVPVVVRAAGKADKCTFAHVQPDGGSDVTIVLAEGVSLTVQAQGRADLLQDAQVTLVPADPVHTEALAYPWFLPAVLGAERLDAEGRAVVPGLPLGAAVAAIVAGPAFAGVRSADVALRRSGGVATVAIEPAALLRGEVVDEQGNPVAGALVCCAPAGRSPHAATDLAGLVPVQAVAAGAAAAVSDANGRFAVARPATGAVALHAAHQGGAVEVELAAAAPPPRLLLPAVVAAARLHVTPPMPGRAWWLRCDSPVGSFTAQPADVPAVLSLAPAVATLRVRVGSGDAFGPVREQREFVLNGDIALPAALLQR